MLPRMIDIARAQLPGGNCGEYQIGAGFSGLVLYKLGLSAPGFREIVAAAPDDEAVAERVLRLDEGAISRLNARLGSVRAADVPAELKPDFERYYGPNVPPERNVFDLLEDDDAGKLVGSPAKAS